MGRQQGEEEVHVPCENNNLNGKLEIEVLSGSRTLSTEGGGSTQALTCQRALGCPAERMQMVIAPGLVLGAYLKEPLLRSEGEGGQEGRGRAGREPIRRVEKLSTDHLQPGDKPGY